jgi:hypothetical protein
MDTYQVKYDAAERRSLLALRILREVIESFGPVAGDKAMLKAIEAEIGPGPMAAKTTSNEP